MMDVNTILQIAFVILFVVATLFRQQYSASKAELAAVIKSLQDVQRILTLVEDVAADGEVTVEEYQSAITTMKNLLK